MNSLNFEIVKYPLSKIKSLVPCMGWMAGISYSTSNYLGINGNSCQCHTPKKPLISFFSKTIAKNLEQNMPCKLVTTFSHARYALLFYKQQWIAFSYFSIRGNASIHRSKLCCTSYILDH